jgi:hypothetical protein
MQNMLLEKSWKMAESPVPPIEWDEYESQALTAWRNLLDLSPEESELQDFLERHPSFVPGAFSFPESGHSPFHGVVFSQPRLQGQELWIPDFMWIAADSATIYPVLVEIERPGKKWFTEKGVPTADLSQAMHQLRCWADWFSRGLNQEWFRDAYELPDFEWRHRKLQPQFVLAFGRRAEFDARPELNRLRPELGPDKFLMTLDRLAPSRKARDYLCVRLEGRKRVARYIPPTLRVGPYDALSLSTVEGKIEALECSTSISAERKQFLRERFEYWDIWARTRPANGFVSIETE